MNKLLGLLIIFTINVCQLAYAQDNQPPQQPAFVYMGYNAPHYTRIPSSKKPTPQKIAAVHQEMQPDDLLKIYNVRPYVGVDFGQSYLSAGKENMGVPIVIHSVEAMLGSENSLKKVFPTHFTPLTYVFGVRIGKQWGVEAFYQQEDKRSKGSRETATGVFSNYGIQRYSSLKYKAIGVDALYYMPLTKQLESVFSVGAAEYKFSGKLSSDAYFYNEFTGTDTAESFADQNFKSWGGRIGVGLQYNLNQHIAVRGMAHYVKLFDDKYVKDIMEFSLGLRFGL